MTKATDLTYGRQSGRVGQGTATEARDAIAAARAEAGDAWPQWADNDAQNLEPETTPTLFD